MAAGIRKGGAAEDGTIPERYRLEETPEHNYEQRTMWNVRDADATMIVTVAGEPTGGTLLTRQSAESICRYWLHAMPNGDWRQKIRDFFRKHSIRVLNVAGPAPLRSRGHRTLGARGIERDEGHQPIQKTHPEPSW
ncbi:YpsA SLOG family protein [Nitrospira sp. Nam74]